VTPRSGDVVYLDKAASVQFALRPRLLRIIRVHDWPTATGWIWLDGYELNTAGDAVERRSVYVQTAGLKQIGKAPDPRTRNTRRPTVAAASRVPEPPHVPPRPRKATR
jgi:hypothetical protein